MHIIRHLTIKLFAKFQFVKTPIFFPLLATLPNPCYHTSIPTAKEPSA